ncbi:MAG: tetratricopeptide repeat protein [Verrucomicrobiota bacterium]|jgi:TolA-binding protein
MAFRWRWLLILLALSTGGERSFAASAREDRAYAAAVTAFQDGMWGRAETELAQFVQKYPKSDRMAGAVLMQAEAEFKQGKLPPAIALLTAHKADAGNLADEYAYWIGEAQYRGRDFPAAAETFVSLARDFPESSLRLQAVVEASASLAQTNEWPRVVSLLEPTNGVFQRAVQMDPANELVSRGQLLLARAKFAQNDFAGAAAVLVSLNSQTLLPELDWQRAYWLYQVKLAAGDLNAALAATTNLVQIGQSEKNDGWQAEGLALRAGVLEQLGRKPEAIAVYQEILALNVPGERTRQAILKIAELSIALGRFSDAEESLQKFPAQFPNSPAADLALLTLGELHLKEYVTQPAATNQLPAAQTNFDQFLRTGTNSPLAGRAYLDQGWCLWLAGKIPESFDAFKAAAQRLPPSEDLAVARFKKGDALFAQKDFTNALENYRAVADDFANFPAVVQTLGDRALYQMLRADLESTNVDGASSAMARILKLYPASDLADSSLLLVGEGLADARQPAAARALFQKFVETLPNSPLRPQVGLAIARTYEREQDWPSAIAQYESWRSDFPTNVLRPQADCALARANFQAGNETNAFGLFTNFVAQFPTNELAPLAQYWVADHYFRLGGTNYVDAERNYKMLYQNTNWQGLPLVYTNLAYQARLMAGRAAMGLPSYNDAIDHFTSLTSDTNCPPGLNAQALFAYGSALMLKDSPDTNNPLANFQLATNVFNQICQLYPTNELNAQAWIEIGDCDLQLGAFDAATNAYAQVFGPNAPATISARSRAQIGFGIALEKKAAAAGGDQTALLQFALDNYLAVFVTQFGENDPFWVKKAGLQALPLMELPALSGVADPDKFIDNLETLFPQARDSLEKKRAALRPAKN